MPFDTQVTDVLALQTQHGVRASVEFAEDGLLNSDGIDPQILCRAQETFGVWAGLRRWRALDLVVLRGANRFSVVSSRGSRLFEADAPFNIGLLRRALKDLPRAEHTAPEPRFDPTPFSAEGRVIWAIAERLARVEAPRRLEFLFGQKEFVLEAERGRFAVVQEDGGLPRFLNCLQEAACQGLQIEYTMGQAQGLGTAPQHGVAALFANDPRWTFSDVGWPQGVPETLPFDLVRDLAATCRHMVSASFDQIDFFCLNGRRLLRLRQTQDQIAVEGLTPSAHLVLKY